MNALRRYFQAAFGPLALLCLGAAPAPKVIPYPRANGEALVVPANSPVKFQGWDEDSGYAKFKGRFVLTGTFTYGCWAGCADYEGKLEEEDLQVRIVPDRELWARLPNWKFRSNDMAILIEDADRLASSVAGPEVHTALLSGEISAQRGRISIVVDDFRTGIECDSAHFSARFVSVVKAPKLTVVEFSGDYGCG